MYPAERVGILLPLMAHRMKTHCLALSSQNTCTNLIRYCKSVIDFRKSCFFHLGKVRVKDFNEWRVQRTCFSFMIWEIENFAKDCLTIPVFKSTNRSKIDNWDAEYMREISLGLTSRRTRSNKWIASMKSLSMRISSH